MVSKMRAETQAKDSELDEPEATARSSDYVKRKSKVVSALLHSCVSCWVTPTHGSLGASTPTTFFPTNSFPPLPVSLNTGLVVPSAFLRKKCLAAGTKGVLAGRGYGRVWRAMEERVGPEAETRGERRQEAS